jgi:hypothetical protein
VTARASTWEITLLRRPPGSGRARVMGRLRFQAPDARRARQAAEAGLAARAHGEPRWSLGVLRALTADAPGTHAYVVTFAAWEDHGERYRRRDVHELKVWATDASSARRLASEQVQAVPGYLPPWRIRRVSRTTEPRARGTARRRAPAPPGWRGGRSGGSRSGP